MIVPLIGPHRILSLALLLVPFCLQAGWQIAEDGKARCAIVEQADAAEPEKAAVRKLADALRQITGAEFKVEKDAKEIPQRAIIVGPGALAEKYFPELDLASLGAEELVMRVKEEKLLLAGGRPRGTLYAVNRFLQEQCGVRWWTPWATNMPAKKTLEVADLDVREKPAFEYRAPFWFAGFEPTWKVHNCANDS